MSEESKTYIRSFPSGKNTSERVFPDRLADVESLWITNEMWYQIILPLEKPKQPLDSKDTNIKS